MPTINELAAELGIDVATLKPEAVTKWNGYFADAESKAAEAQKKLTEAQTLQSVIDQNIASFGMTETNMAELKANNAALAAANASYKAAMDELKKQGFSGINIPDIPAGPTPPPSDPIKNLQNLIVQGFTNVNQTAEVNNRHMALFGKPMPDSPSALADEAAAHRMSVTQWADQKYGFAAKQQEVQAAAQADHDRKVAEAAVAKYRESNPSNAGNPELNGGLPSNYPQAPPPRDAKNVREFAGMSTRDKIQNALQRAAQVVGTRGSV